LLVALLFAELSVFGAVTANDIFAKTEFTAGSKAGMCVLIDCSAALVEDVFLNSNFKVYARFADRAQYDALLASAEQDVQDALFKELCPEYLPASDNKIPFPDRYLNLLVVNGDMDDAECERVVSPGYPFFEIDESAGTVPDKKTALYPAVISGNTLGDNNEVKMDDEIKHPFMSRWIYQGEFEEENHDLRKDMDGFEPTTLGYGFGETQVRSAFNGEILYDVTTPPACVMEDKKWNKESDSLKRYSAVSGEYDGKTINVSSGLSVLGLRNKVLYLYGTNKVEAVDLTPGVEAVLWTYSSQTSIKSADFGAMISVSDSAVFYVDTDLMLHAIGLDGVSLDVYETPVGDNRKVLIAQEGLVVLASNKGIYPKIDTYKLEAGVLSHSHLFSGDDEYDGIHALGITKAGDILTSLREVFDAEGNSKGRPAMYGCSGPFNFFNNSTSGQKGPKEDYLTGQTYYMLGNKSRCSTGGYPSNGSIFQKMNMGCRCYFAYGIFGWNVFGTGDAGIDMERVPPVNEKTFQETNHNTIVSENTLVVDRYDWSMFRKNKTHSAYTPVVTKETSDGSWDYQIPFENGNLTPAVTVGDYAFLGTEGGYLYGLEIDDVAQTTTKVWEKRLPSEIRVSPTVWNSRLFVGCEDGMVYCYEAKTGRLLWRFLAGPKNRKIRFDQKIKSTWPISSTVAIEEVNGTNYAFFVAGRLACDGTYVYKLNPLTGEAVWQTNIGVEQGDDPSKWTPPVTDWNTAANATFISIAKGHLWVGGFRYNHFAGVNLDSGEKMRQPYEVFGRIDNRGVYTAFFRDYLIYGGQELYCVRDGDEGEIRAGADVSLSTFKIQEDGLAKPMADGLTRRLQVFNGDTLTWDNNYLFTGRSLFNADLFESKLDETYVEEFVPEKTAGKGTIVLWDDISSLYMYSDKLYLKTHSPLLTETAIWAGDRESATKVYAYKKVANTPMLMNISYGTNMVQNGMVINRNGVLVISTVSGNLKFIDVGDAPGTAHVLAVATGRGDGEYLEDSIVMIKADVVPGKRFTEWTGDTSYIDDVNSSVATIMMPNADISVTANHEDVDPISLTVNNGSGSGVYYDGYVAPIAAMDSPPGYIFSEWARDVDAVDGVYEKETTVTVPASDIEIAALYRNKSSILVDFGASTNQTPSNWNNFYTMNGTDASATITNVVLESGATQGSLELAAQGVNTAHESGKPATCADYPASAITDCLATRYKDIDLYFNSLNDDCKYNLKMLVHPSGTQKTKYYINDMTAENFVLEEAGDSAQTKNFYTVSPVDGQIHVR